MFISFQIELEYLAHYYSVGGILAQEGGGGGGIGGSMVIAYIYRPIAAPDHTFLQPAWVNEPGYGICFPYRRTLIITPFSAIESIFFHKN
jgi:hypothetical protein